MFPTLISLIVEMSFGLGGEGEETWIVTYALPINGDYSKHYIPVLQKGGERNGIIKF